MKKLLILTILVLAGFAGFSQTPIQFLGSPKNRVEIRGQSITDSIFWATIRDTTFIPPFDGAINFRPANGVFYGYANGRWNPFLPGVFQPLIAPSNVIKQYWNGFQNFVTFNTDSIAEGSTNLYFTNARARAAISLTTTGTSGAATYNSTTGVLNVPSYTSGGSGSIDSVGLAMPSIFSVTNSPLTGTGGTIAVAFTTEGNNTFFAGPSLGGPLLPTFRVMAVSDLPVGIPNGNLANSNLSFSIGSTGTSPNWQAGSVSLGGTAVLNLPIASTANTGVLSAGDWNTFNNKVTSVNGLVGVVVTKSADSIKKLPVDTSSNRNGYVLAFDSVAHKWYLTAPGGSGSGVANVGTIDGNSAAANGASILGSSIFMQSASASNPGLVNNTTQTLSGNKTLTGSVFMTGLTGKSVAGTDSVIIRDVAGKLWSSNVIVSADNGLTSNTPTNIQLGGYLTKNDTLKGQGLYWFRVDSTLSAYLRSTGTSGRSWIQTASGNITIEVQNDSAAGNPHNNTAIMTLANGGAVGSPRIIIQAQKGSGGNQNPLLDMNSVDSSLKITSRYVHIDADTSNSNNGIISLRWLRHTLDTTTYRPVAINPTTGQLVEMSSWIDGGPGAYTFTNGLTESPARTVGIGGTLSKIDTINTGSAYSLKFIGSTAQDILISSTGITLYQDKANTTGNLGAFITPQYIILDNNSATPSKQTALYDSVVSLGVNQGGYTPGVVTIGTNTTTRPNIVAEDILGESRLATTPQKGSFEYYKGYWYLTDSLNPGGVTRDTIATRGWARANISGGGGGGSFTAGVGINATALLSNIIAVDTATFNTKLKQQGPGMTILRANATGDSLYYRGGSNSTTNNIVTNADSSFSVVSNFIFPSSVKVTSGTTIALENDLTTSPGEFYLYGWHTGARGYFDMRLGPVATTTNNGLMSAADKVKLDSSIKVVNAGGTGDTISYATTALDTLVLKRISVVGSGGITVTPTISQNKILYTVSGGSSSGYSITTAANTANYTVPTGTKIFVYLSDLTGQANRNVVLPAATTGDEFVFVNLNTDASTFNWTFTSGTVKNYAQSTITTLTNISTYHLVYGGTNYQIINE